MKIYTSYFYQVRFFKPNMIPLSTAIYDPVWYHKGHDKKKVFVNKNLVYNGLRCEAFMPIMHEDGKCDGTCTEQVLPADSPETCKFLRYYKEQLDKLNIDDVLHYFEDIANILKIKDPIIVLLVHEAPDNKCSERRTIQEWFKNNGIIVTELNPKEFI